MGSFTDLQTWIGGIRTALGIKGEQAGPGLVSTDQVQFIVDSLQGGFSRYVREWNSLTTGAFPISQVNTIQIFSPDTAIFPKASILNNAQKEIRLIVGRINITGVTNAATGSEIYLTLQFEKIDAGLIINGPRIRLNQVTGVATYEINLPNSTDEFGTNTDLQSFWNWDGWIPANTQINILFLKNGSGWIAATSATIDLFWVEVPKNSILPK